MSACGWVNICIYELCIYERLHVGDREVMHENEWTSKSVFNRISLRTNCNEVMMAYTKSMSIRIHIYTCIDIHVTYTLEVYIHTHADAGLHLAFSLNTVGFANKV